MKVEVLWIITIAWWCTWDELHILERTFSVKDSINGWFLIQHFAEWEPRASL